MRIYHTLIPLMAFILSAHAGPQTSPPTPPETQESNASSVDDRYPFSEIEKIYDTVLDAMTSKYLKNRPGLEKTHMDAMRVYITKAESRDEFLNLMIKGDTRTIFERAVKDVNFRKTKEFESKFSTTVFISVKISMMIIGAQIDIYAARFIDKDPMKTELFSMAGNNTDVYQYISWISQEISAKEAKDAYKDASFLPGDRVFQFSSPEWTWKELHGRQGYLVVREGKIFDTVITIMN